MTTGGVTRSGVTEGVGICDGVTREVGCCDSVVITCDVPIITKLITIAKKKKCLTSSPNFYYKKLWRSDRRISLLNIQQSSQDLLLMRFGVLNGLLLYNAFKLQLQ